MLALGRDILLVAYIKDVLQCLLGVDFLQTHLSQAEVGSREPLA